VEIAPYAILNNIWLYYKIMFKMIFKKNTTKPTGRNLFQQYGMPNQSDLSTILTKYYGDTAQESYFKHHMQTSYTFRDLATNIMKWTGRTDTDDTTIQRIASDLQSFIADNSTPRGGKKSRRHKSRKRKSRKYNKKSKKSRMGDFPIENLKDILEDNSEMIRIVCFHKYSNQL